MTNLLGPNAFGADNASSSRPPVTPENSGATPDYWFKDCSSQTVRDGTEILAPWMNALMAQIRQTIRRSGVAEDNTDDDMVARAIRGQRANWLTAGGGANAITLNPQPAFSTLSDMAGVPMRFLVAASNTTAVTLNVNAKGARDVVSPDGAALTAKNLIAGTVVEVVYDGTRFVITSSGLGAAGARVARERQIYTAGTSSWTVPTGVYKIYFRLWGGGGGGGYAAAGSCASGGAGGGYLDHILTVAPGDVLSVTVGAAGAGGLVGTPASNGGDTTLVHGATSYIAYGGEAGKSATTGQAQTSTVGGDTSANGTITRRGEGGRGGTRGYGGGTTTLWYGGNGGAAYLGGFGANSGTTGGLSGNVPGGGAGGGASNTASGVDGNAGARGEIIIEY